MNLIEGLPLGLGGGFWFLLILIGVLLDWLIGESAWCLPMGPGQYRVEVTVTANPDTLIARSQTIISNVFEVTP